MIETNIQQQGSVFQQPPLPMAQAMTETSLTVTCALCDAVYAASPQQLPFLQYAQEALETAFMGICHFCFRCRRVACPECWDDVHGVCGVCVQDAGLPFRAAATPMDGLMFPPLSIQFPSRPSPQQHISSFFVLVHTGRFSTKTQASVNTASTDLDTDSLVQPVITQSETNAPARPVPDSDTPLTADVTTSIKRPLPETPQDTRKQEMKPHAAKTGKKASRLEQVCTWIVLVIVLLLVLVIALAEFIPAVNSLVAHVMHIDIHAEIAYLVHTVQQLFKR